MNLFAKLKKMKILLIDDNEWIRDSMTVFLENEGCSLLALETAEEAIDTIEKNHYDIIISDYRLPNMNGLEFFEIIQQTCRESFKILITAYGTKDVFSKAKQLGVHDIIEKPFKTENIEASLSLHMKDVYE